MGVLPPPQEKGPARATRPAEQRAEVSMASFSRATTIPCPLPGSFLSPGLVEQGQPRALEGRGPHDAGEALGAGRKACGPQEATSSASAPTGRASWGTGALNQPRGGGSFGEMTFLQPMAEAPHPQATQYRLQTRASPGHHYTRRCGPCRAEPALTHPPMPTGRVHSGHQPSTSCM